MSRATERPSGAHPSGAHICQTCGGSAALVATHGPDAFRLRRRHALVCEPCARTAGLVAERFRLTLVLRPIDARSLSDL